MLLDDIVDLLSSAGTTSDGFEVKKSLLPPRPNSVVAVLEPTGGLEPVSAMGSGTAATVLARPRIQVLVRSTDYPTVRFKAQQVFHTLHHLQARAINGVQYYHVAAVQQPFSIGRDENERERISMNFDIARAVATSS